MGRFKDALIEDMNVRQVNELVNKHRGNNDPADPYIVFFKEEEDEIDLNLYIDV